MTNTKKENLKETFKIIIPGFFGAFIAVGFNKLLDNETNLFNWIGFILFSISVTYFVFFWFRKLTMNLRKKI